MANYPLIEKPGKTLVTGANGFIGSRLCQAFVKAGIEVVAGVRQGAKVDTLADLNIPLAYGDVTRTETLAELVNNVEVVVHNAGLVKAKKSAQLFEVNSRGALKLLRACLESPTVRRFVLVSSQAAAGPSTGRPLNENDPPAPITSYGESKLQAEKEILKYTDQINIQIVRPPGVYGPGDHEVFSFFQALSYGLRPLIGDTSRAIQLVYVDDLARGIVQLVEHDLPSGEVYFLAEDRSYSYRELTRIVGEAVGKKGFPVKIPGWAFEFLGALSQTLCALTPITPMLTLEKSREVLASWEVSVEKAQAHFDFSPSLSFSEGADRAVAWYRDHGWLT